jgi:CubicO group peptidase (beta-lactamase class C family)
MHDFNGVVLVARRGRILAKRAYGVASFELAVRNMPETKFGIGSLTKSFTAAAIELLAEQGRLKLEDPVSRWLTVPKGWEDVTIERLLSHSAGVPDYNSLPEYAAHRCDPISPDEFAHLIAGKPLDFPPGSQDRYSSSGYSLLALVVERVSGVSYSRFLREQLLEPLRLKNTGDLHDGDLIRGLAPGYDAGFPPERVQPAAGSSWSWRAGSGSIYSTAGDLYRWLEATRSERLVHISRLPYPYGWGKRTAKGRDFIEQTGRVPEGYSAYMAMYPTEDVAVVVLNNIAIEVTERIGRDLAAFALGDEYEIPVIRKGALTVIAVDQATLSAFEGQYEFAPGFAVSVKRGSEGLLLAGPEGLFVPLETEGSAQFFFRTLQIPVEFERDDKGSVTQLRWGSDVVARRLIRPDGQ